MYDVKGVGFIKSVLENKYIKVEWRTTDKIILPYKEVL
jgi:hypothetical protein